MRRHRRGRRCAPATVASRSAIAIAYAVCVVLGTGPATAQDSVRTIRGTVVRVDGDDLIIDVGNASGADETTEWTLLRPIVVRHPVSGRPLRDQFPIATVHISQLGQTLSIARVTAAPARTPAVGDVLTAEVARASRPGSSGTSGSNASGGTPISRGPGATTQTPAPPTGGNTPTGATVSVIDYEQRAVLDAFMFTLGQRPAERILRYQLYLRENPTSHYAARVSSEIAALRRLRDGSTESNMVNADARTPPLPEHHLAVAAPEFRGAGLAELNERERPVLALHVTHLRNVRGILVILRQSLDAGWTQYAVQPAGDGMVRFEIPPRFVQAPGFSYFVEIVNAQGVEIPLHGEPDAPIRVTVHPRPAPDRDTAGMSRIQVRSDFVDRNRLNGNDRYFLVEADFAQRVRLGPLYAWRVGFGVYRGAGGSLRALDANSPPRFMQAVYGYHEVEFEVARLFSICLRLSVGMNDRSLIGGAQLRLRFGEERGVHLVVGGDVLSAIGQRAFIDFIFRPLPRLPMGAFTEVTNFAYDMGDPAFRLGLQIGYQFTDWFSLAARVSYQARTIVHAGPGAGLAATFDW